VSVRIAVCVTVGVAVPPLRLWWCVCIRAVPSPNRARRYTLRNGPPPVRRSVSTACGRRARMRRCPLVLVCM
ncbi:hypothetical protein EV714DRAFT_241814, partial [Schizophyllum commune]